MTDDATSDDELVAANPAKIAKTTFVTSSAFTRPPAFVSHPDFLAVNVARAPAETLLSDLDKALGVKLKARGEVHITVLTPPEISSLARKLPMRDIEALAAAQHLEETAWTPVCVGFRSAGSCRNNLAI